MTPPPPPSTTDDQGCLRQVLAVPLVILQLLAAWCCYTALTIRPSGPWDDDARAGIALSCALTLATSALALLITVVPSVRRTMGPWWLVPPLVLGVAAAVRWVLGG
ncbi:hypothetical protein [Streptomyces scopuliridis]|uniref:hypothetical protein n=1 Tax=Streptomyces scopuliridis TaxID=452529 RepID=UPI0004BF78BB|nr:hypothetical protein [Streptomyces scopuliridis]